MTMTEIPTLAVPDEDAEVIELRPGEAPEPGEEPEPQEEQGEAETPEAPPAAELPEPAPVLGPGERRPIIPVALQRKNIKATIRHHAGLNAHRAGYHGIRLHWYILTTLWFAGRGAVALFAALMAHINWTEGWLLESEAVARGGRDGLGDAHRIHTQGAKTRSKRWQITAYIFGALALAVLAGVVYLPRWAWIAPGVVLVLVLAYYGKPEGKQVIQRAVVPARYEAPTTEIIMRALGSLGISLLTKAVDAGAQMVVTPGVHRDGPGWCARIELPHGVTAVDVIARREALASALRRPLSATWPAPLPHEHPGMLELWIGFSALNKQAPVVWPLVKAGKADLFGEIPFGADQRGKVVALTLMFASVLIGAMPRMGKTMALRILALACALDPTARLRVWELKGTGDLAALKHVAHEYGSGADPGTLDDCLASVRAYHRQLDIRAKTLSDQPDHLRPENKVTPALAASRKLGLFPDILIIDEVQEALTDPDRKAEFESLLTAITKRGPALGMILLLATQRPDAKSLPSGISANILIRFCLKVMKWDSSNMVLGDGMSTAGYNAADFVRSDKGIGWLTGETDDPMIVRTCYIDAPGAEVIAKRAKAARIAAGTLSGYAAGETDEAPARDVLGDVLSVFVGDGSGMHWATVAERLQGRYPDRWGGVTADAISAQCRDLGVPSAQVKVGGRNLQGCRRLDVEQMAGQR